MDKPKSEIEKAQTAKEEEDTIFGKIARKEIKSDIVYEDDLCLAFRDLHPQAPVHVILIPKKLQGLTQLSKAKPEHKDILGHLMIAAANIAKKEKLEEGWRLVINDGKHGGQSVYHLHIHILGGKQLGWPPC